MDPLIRVATTEDARQIADIYRPFVDDNYVSFEEGPITEELMRERIAALSVKLPFYVAELDSVVVGYAYASPHRQRQAYRWSVETSVFLNEQARGKGIALKLYDAIFKSLKQRNYINAFAGISLPNVSSVRFHEGCGFEPIGVYKHVGYKAGAWRDVGWWQKVIQPPQDSPTSP